MKIGLDIMGGDYAPHSTLHGALLASKQLSTDEKIVLIGDSNVAKEILQQNNAELSLFEFIHADDQIAKGKWLCWPNFGCRGKCRLQTRRTISIRYFSQFICRKCVWIKKS